MFTLASWNDQNFKAIDQAQKMKHENPDDMSNFDADHVFSSYLLKKSSREITNFLKFPYVLG